MHHIIYTHRDEALRCFDACHAELKERNLLPLEIGAKEGYAEIVQRHKGRYEMRYSLEDGNIFKDPRLLEHPQLRQVSKHRMMIIIIICYLSAPYSFMSMILDPLTLQVLDDIFGGREAYQLLDQSIILALPGTEDQAWHADGSHLCLKTHQPCHCLNVFIPLIDITHDLGPTEFRPGSHVYTRDLARMMLLAKVKKTLREPQCPALETGDVVLFDYRVLHRGRANTSADVIRPVLVLTYAKKGFKDVFNFPKRSIRDQPLPSS